MKNKILKTALLAIGLLTVNISCSEDFVDRDFYQEVEQGPFTNVQEMESFTRGLYVSMRSPYYYGCDFLAYGEVRSDEMYSNGNSGYYVNVKNYSQVAADGYAKDTWNYIYQTVAKANVIINTDISAFTANDKKSANFLQGQAYAVRALNFFDLLRVYGEKYTGSPTSLGIVLPLKYEPTAKQARSTIAETESQIEADFAKAEQFMLANPRSTDKTELSIAALKGLMARYYLYKGDYAKVRQLVDYVVASQKYQVVSASDLQKSFTSSSGGNSIFELAVGNVASLSTNSYAYKINSDGYGNVVVNPDVVNIYEANDARLDLITEIDDEFFISNSSDGLGKYLDITGSDNVIMLRYEEILLDGVEAELNGGNQDKALDYLNEIRTKRNLSAATSVDIVELKKERTRELLGEGLRQWDLRRWGDAVPRPTGVSTNPLLNAFPIPLSETNVGVVQSNPGYDN